MSGSVSLRLFLGAIFLGMVAGAPQAGAQSAAQTATLGPSGLPLPRFVSLKASRVNSRIGPGLNYSVDWMYTKAGLPMEIVQEYDTWRKVRDSDGSEGWVNQTLLSGKRTALVKPWQSDKSDHIKLLGAPQKDAPVVAILEPGVMGAITTCNGQWCEMTLGGHTGWIRQSQIWGAYPGEKFKD